MTDRRRVAVRVTPDALRQIRGGHPWVYEASITSTSHEGAPGDLAVVFDSNRRFVAIGLYDPTSPIRIRVLHRGKPVPIDQHFWAERIVEAAERRRELAESGSTTGYRCIHGENDQLPGLVLDRYGDVHVLKLYSTAWTPWVPTILPLLEEHLDVRTLVVRLSRVVDAKRAVLANGTQTPDGTELTDGTTVLGERPRGPVGFLEHDLRFEAEVVRGHKTGHFLDQRDNRARVRTMAQGARVLDVFSYTGGFSVHAAAGGASAVCSVDVNPHASATVSRHFELNRDLDTVRACRQDALTGDAFEVMRSLAARRERFDIVVIDPPSFASKRSDIVRALAAYGRLTELGVDLVSTNGLLVQASCSSRVSAEQFFASVHQAASQRGRRLDEVERTGHPVDHPIGFAEGAYLKALFAHVQ